MRSSLRHILLLLTATIVVVALIFFRTSQNALHSTIVILAALILLLLNLSVIKVVRERLSHISGVLLLFLTTILVQLVVLSTGSVRSPFFILFHLFFLGVSILFSLDVGLVFLFSSIIVLGADNFVNQTISDFFQQDPGTVMLYLVSYLTIIPLAHTIAKRYHLKDEINTLLSNQIETEEQIIDSVQELVIVTDSHLKVLSVNDAVEQTLHTSRAELLDKNLFECIYLKDPAGALFRADMIPLTQIIQDHLLFKKDNLRLLSANTQGGTVKLQARATSNAENGEAQITFILLQSGGAPAPTPVPTNPTQAEFTVKRDARFASLQKMIHGLSRPDVELQLSLLMKLQQDSEYLTRIDAHELSYNPVKFDLARMTQDVVNASQSFASALHVGLSFSFVNFGERDIAPLMTKVFSVRPEQLTGPFFTVTNDVKETNVLMQKLLDMSILLSSTEREPHIAVTIGRDGPKHVVVTFKVTSPSFIVDEIPLLWKRTYGTLLLKTNLQIGSGYEGYIASVLAETVHVPLNVTYNQDSSILNIRLLVEK